MQAGYRLAQGRSISDRVRPRSHKLESELSYNTQGSQDLRQHALSFESGSCSRSTDLVLPVDVDPGLDELVQRVGVAEARRLPQLLLHDARRGRPRDQRRAELARGEHDLRRRRRGQRRLQGRRGGNLEVESLFGNAAEQKRSSAAAAQRYHCCSQIAVRGDL